MCSLFGKHSVDSEGKGFKDYIALRTNVINDAISFKNIVVPPSITCMTKLASCLDGFQEIETVEDYKNFIPEILKDLKRFKSNSDVVTGMHLLA